MHRLVVNPGTPQAWEIRLKPGLNRIGRGAANDFCIDDPSVSTAHCEIVSEDDSLYLKDLGSTNGTFVDRMPVDGASVRPGQRVQLGFVEMMCEEVDPAQAAQAASPAQVSLKLQTSASPGPEPASGLEAPTTFVARTTSVAPPPATAPRLHVAAATPSGESPDAVRPTVAAPAMVPVVTDGPVFCKNHYQNAARFKCAKCNRFLCDLCVNTRGSAAGGLTSCRACTGPVSPVSMSAHVPKEVNFYRSVPVAFKYPVQGDGVILLFCGVFYFGFLDAANYIALHAGKYGMRPMMMRAVFITFVLGIGYLFSYLKKIIYATASGDHRMPDWPELSEWQADILSPMFHFLVVSVLSFGPAIAFGIWADGDYQWAVWLLVLAGCFYFPMGMLGVAMFDTLGALNPLFVIGSILKVLREYCVAALVFTVILGFRWLVQVELASVLHIPLVPTLIADLLGIYLLIVETRILGLLYLARKDTLGWFKVRKLVGGKT